MTPVAFTPFGAWVVLKTSLDRGDHAQANEAARAIVAWLWRIVNDGTDRKARWELLDPSERHGPDSRRLLESRIQSVLAVYHRRAA